MKQPSDDEYLDELYDVFADEGWARRLAEAGRNPAAEDLAGLDPDVERQLRAEFADPRLAFRGIQVDQIRKLATAMLGDDAKRVEAIPVVLAPTFELNAFAVRTPRGSAVIVLNNAVFWTLPLLFFCYAALDSAEGPEPLAEGVPQVALADSILALAAFCATNDFRRLTEAPALSGALEGALEVDMIMYAVYMECFILIHEYGHVLRGHLDAEDVTTTGERGLTMFQTEWDQEYEADAFAVEQMLQRSEGKLRKTDVAIWCGLLLNYFALVEAISPTFREPEPVGTHPPARERWSRIAELVDLPETPDAYAARFDYWFPRLANWWAETHTQSGERRVSGRP